jgi:hypothetical protein
LANERAVAKGRPWAKIAPSYTFKTYGYEAGLNELTLDAICGHAARTQGEDYTQVTLKRHTKAMAAFPRYRVNENAGQVA